MQRIGDIRLHYPLSALSAVERERLADTISTVAADMKKGAVGRTSVLFPLIIKRDMEDGAGEAMQ